MSGVIGFKKAWCQDCYKCVRECPVKAIRTKEEHVRFVAEDCVLCGRCLESCPQHAITFLSDLDKVKSYLNDKIPVVVSLTPAYLSVFNEIQPGQVIEGLHRLGFGHIRETAEAAAYITEAYGALLEAGTMENIITSSCPAITEMIEKYYPDMIPFLAPVVTPSIAHGRMLKQEFGQDVKVVCISACIADKREALRDDRTKGAVDVVITFAELKRWFEEEGIDLSQCGSRKADNASPQVSSLYAVSRGIVTALITFGGGNKTSMFHKYKTLIVDGMEHCNELFQCIRDGDIKYSFIEMNSCMRGCINGPVSGGNPKERFKRKIYMDQRVDYEIPDYPPLHPDVDISKKFEERKSRDLMPSEEEIQKVLLRIHKNSVNQELNCGACGYQTCREKAIAVCQGKSGLNMCLPFMYDQAKSMSDVILTVTPNLIILVDDRYRILEFNNAAEVAFNVSKDRAVGTSLSDYIDIRDFVQVFEEKRSIINKKVYYESYNLVTNQDIIYIKEQNAALAIIRDVTAEDAEASRRHKLRMETVGIAQRVIDKQMLVAQEIAGLLGETTAETKVILSQLRDSMLYDGEELE